MSNQEQAGDGEQKKKRRWRPRFNWLSAQWSPTAGFAVGGVGIVGAAAMLVIWLVAGGGPETKEPGQAGAPTSTTASQSSASTVVTTSTVITNAPPPVGGGGPGPGPVVTMTGEPPAVGQTTTDRRLEPEPPPIVFGATRVEHDASVRDCQTGYRFHFYQDITMNKAGTITYRWERSDGAIQTEPDVLTFDAPGTKTVTTWWQRSGTPGERLEGSEWVHILTPGLETEGPHISFDHTC